MPTLLDMNDILKKMTSDSGYRYREKGKEKVLKNLSLDQAVKYLNKIIDAQVDSKNFQKHLDDFRKKKPAYVKGNPKHFKTHLEGDNEEMQRRLGYSVKCRKAMLDIHKRYMERHQTLWNETVVQVFGAARSGKPTKDVKPLRWMDRLLRADGSPESQAHNEKLVTLAAWRNRVIDADQFQALRASYYQKNGKSVEEAQMLAQQERDYGMDALLDMYRQKVNDTYHRSDEIMEAGRAILSGNCRNVEAAYEILLAAGEGIYLAFDSKDAMNNMLDSPAFRNAEARRAGLLEESLHYEGLLGGINAIVEMSTDVVPSPQYAYLDPADLQKSGVGMLESGSLGKDWDAVYANNVNEAINRMVSFSLAEWANDFGFPGDSDSLLNSPDTLVYKDEKSGRTMVVDIEELDLEHGLKGMKVNENVPGRLLNKHLKEDVENWLSDLNELTVSPQYARSSLKMRLEEVRDSELSDVPDDYEIACMRRTLSNLKDTVEMYQRELAEMTEDREVNPEGYERSEKFATKLSILVEIKQNQLTAVEDGVRFIKNYKIEDNLDSIGEERMADGERTRKIMDELLSKKAEPENGGQILDKIADENIIRTEAQSPEQAAEGKMKATAAHDTLKATQDDYKSHYRIAAEQYKSVSEQLDAAESSAEKKLSNEEKMPYLQNEAKWENYANQFGKQWLASQVVGELLELEAKLPEEKRPMHAFAEAGRYDDLVEMVRNSDKFVKEISTADLSQPDEAERMMKQRIPKNVAKTIMRNYLANEKKRQGAPKPVAEEQPQKSEQPQKKTVIS